MAVPTSRYLGRSRSTKYLVLNLVDLSTTAVVPGYYVVRRAVYAEICLS
jgi:hypothetical protein